MNELPGKFTQAVFHSSPGGLQPTTLDSLIVLFIGYQVGDNGCASIPLVVHLVFLPVRNELTSEFNVLLQIGTSSPIKEIVRYVSLDKAH